MELNTTSDLRARLQQLHQQTAETPLFNPVFQLGHDISRELENGALTLGDIGSLVSDFYHEALNSRSRRLQQLLSPVEDADNLLRWRAILDQSEGCSGG